MIENNLWPDKIFDRPQFMDIMMGNLDVAQILPAAKIIKLVALALLTLLNKFLTIVGQFQNVSNLPNCQQIHDQNSSYCMYRKSCH